MAKTNINLKVKVGILHTIAKSIYASTDVKIREAVSNSIDNDASFFIIFLDRATRSMSLFDNGSGITRERFKEIFESLGYGLYRDNNKLSYFGLGLMSIMQLGKSAKVVTKTSGKDEILLLDIKADKIFEKEVEKESIETLSKYINLSDSDFLYRNTISPLSEATIKEVFGDIPDSFTEIIIENLYDADLEKLSEEGFINDLRKQLPLKIDDDETFLNRIADPLSLKKMKEIFSDKKYFPSIDVYFGIEEEKPLRQIFKYFPDFREELEFGKGNLLADKTDKFAYFILYATGEALEEREKENPDRGFWVRNRNFLVKPADFFQQPGTRQRFIHEPLKGWIYGEIFHTNMNEFLVVSRNDYLWDEPRYKEFRDEVLKIISPLNTDLRKAWEYGDEIAKTVIKPFKEIETQKGPFYKVSKTLAKMGIECDGKDAADILKNFDENKRDRDLEKEELRIDLLLERNKDKIFLIDDENSLVAIDPSIDPRNLFVKSWDAAQKRLNVYISPKLFSPKKSLFLGKSFDIFFVAGEESNNAISIDVQNAKIFVNPFNQEIINYTVSFIDVHIAVELADALAANKAEMKVYILKLLGREFKDASKYLSPLADDLSRKKRRKK